MTLKTILKDKTLPLVLSVLIGAGTSGCAGMKLEKKVKEISSHTGIHGATAKKLYDDAKANE